MSGLLAPAQTMPVNLPPGLDVSLVSGNDPPVPLANLNAHQLSGSPSCLVNNGFSTMLGMGATINQGLERTVNGMNLGVTRQRKYNFSHRDKDLLVTLIERHGDVVESRTADGVSTDQKNAAWNDIQARFNLENDVSLYRSVTELKKCYWNLKQKTKKALDAVKEAGGTNKVDRVLWRIARLAPEQFDALFRMKVEVEDSGTDGDVRVTLRPEAPGARMLMPNMRPLVAARMAESPPDESGGEATPPADLKIFPLGADRSSAQESAPGLQPASAGSAAQQLQQLQEQYRLQAQRRLLQQQQQPDAGSMQQLMQQQQQQQSSQALQQQAAAAAAASFAERWCAAMQWTSAQAPRMPPGFPDMQKLMMNGHAAASAGGGSSMPAVPGAAPPSLRNGSAPASAQKPETGGRGVKRPAGSPPAPPACEAEAELRRTEHEYKMRLLEKESRYQEERHELEMQVLQLQGRFWERSMRRAGHLDADDVENGSHETSSEKEESLPRNESADSNEGMESNKRMESQDLNEGNDGGDSGERKVSMESGDYTSEVNSEGIAVAEESVNAASNYFVNADGSEDENSKGVFGDISSLNDDC